jgi:HEPN domain-containing protein
MTKNELIAYWIESSESNYASMHNMFVNKEYVWSLFVGHLCIEKLLKALYVKKIDINTPRVHDLYKLAIKCNLEMTEEQIDALLYITLFNIEARYEEYKREFYKKCTKNFTEHNINKIGRLRIWLLGKIKN